MWTCQQSCTNSHILILSFSNLGQAPHPFLLKPWAGTTVDPISITVMRIISTLNMKGERWAHSCGWITTLFKAIWSQYGYQVPLPPPSDMNLWPMIWINLGWTVITFQCLLLGNQFGASKVYGKKKTREYHGGGRWRLHCVWSLYSPQQQGYF